jgi:hypothetical protein
MTGLEFLVVSTAVPIGTLVMALVLVYLTRMKPDKKQPGE